MFDMWMGEKDRKLEKIIYPSASERFKKCKITAQAHTAGIN